MADWFDHSSDALNEVQDTGKLLGVFTLELKGVNEPIDPDPLWDRRYGGRSEISERLTGDRDFRLQAALDGCRNSVFKRDSAGRFREANPVFTDVVMWVPEAQWRAGAMRGGGHIESLQYTLAGLHTDKFGRSLPEDRKPRYTVMADPRLAADSVVFQFGFGVFVPDDEDVLEAEIILFKPGDSEMRSLPPWVFWQDGAQTQRQVGVYRGQRSLLISGDNEGPIRPEIWFSERIGHVLVNLNEDDTERLYASTRQICVAETRAQTQPETVEWRLDFEGATGRESLWMRITQVSESGGSAVAHRYADRIKPPERAAIAPDAALSSAAGSEDATVRLSTRFSLQLVGLGLFRIDDTRMTGLEQWVIWLDDWGWPVREASIREIDESSCLAIRSRSGSDQLEIRLAGSRSFEAVLKLPFTLETKTGDALTLLPPPDPQRYLGMLMLNASVALPLSQTPLTLGRATASEKAEPDLPIDLLDHPRSVKWSAGVPHAGARLDAIELSRRHVVVRLVERRLEVAMANGSTPAFALDEDRVPQMELRPRSSDTILLDPGQYLLLGGYVFRFQQGEAHTIASTGGFRSLSRR